MRPFFRKGCFWSLLLLLAVLPAVSPAAQNTKTRQQSDSELVKQSEAPGLSDKEKEQRQRFHR